jgi:hypothetical protein
MILKPQDVLVLLKLVAIDKEPWSYNRLAVDIGMSPAETHAAVQRALGAQLAVSEDRGARPNARNLEEFLLHGIRYVFVPDRGELTRGMPTAHSAPPLARSLVSSDDIPAVWPDADGQVRGEAFSPLYRSVPEAARKDQRLYELLALVDAVRGGRARETQLAGKQLTKRLRHYG